MVLPKIERVVNVGYRYKFTFADENVLQVKYYDKFERRIVRANSRARLSKRGFMREDDIATRLAAMRLARAECQRLSSNSHEARRLWQAERLHRRTERELAIHKTRAAKAAKR